VYERLDGQFFVQAGDHLANAGLRQPLGRYGMMLLEPFQPTLQVAKLVLREKKVSGPFLGDGKGS
jgi:hypothetical protein